LLEHSDGNGDGKSKAYGNCDGIASYDMFRWEFDAYSLGSFDV
jgi:hypothetical protein